MNKFNILLEGELVESKEIPLLWFNKELNIKIKYI